MTRQEAEAVIFDANPFAATVQYHEHQHLIGVVAPGRDVHTYDLRTLDTDILRSLVSPVA
jgi:hypothetical protein